MLVTNTEQKQAKPSRRTKYRASLVTRTLADLHKETSVKATSVVAYILLDSPCDPEVLQKLVMERLLSMPRFRSRYVFKGRSSYFELLEEDELDLDYHLQVVHEKVTFDGAVNYMNNETSTSDLDLEKPLWQVVVFPELENGQGLVVSNISHIIGDGMAQIEVLYRLLDDDAVHSKVTSRPKPKRKQKTMSTLRKATIFVKGVFEGAFAVLGRPDPPSSLKVKGAAATRVKRQVFSPKIPLARCKEVKNKVEGATLNDVFMVLLTMVIKRYYNSTGENPRKVTASFPMDLRKSRDENFDKYGSPHNYFAYGMMRFKLNYKSPVDLFRHLKKLLDEQKISPSPLVQLNLGSFIFRFIGLKARNAIALNLGDKCTAQLSNVAGPVSKVNIGGYGVEDISFQLFTPVGLYIGLFTYNNMLSCSFCANDNLPDPQLLANEWLPAFEELHNEIMSYDGIIKL